MTFIYFISTKAEVKNKLCIFQSTVKRAMRAKMKVLRSSNGKEYINNAFLNYTQNVGIQHQTTVPHSPQQKACVKKQPLHMEKVRLMLSDSSLSRAY